MSKEEKDVIERPADSGAESVEIGVEDADEQQAPDEAGVSDSAAEDAAGTKDAPAAEGAPDAEDSAAEDFAEADPAAELAGLEDRLKRQAAEFENYRRRTEKEKSQMVEFGKTLVIRQLLDVVDDFRRSLHATNEAEAEREDDPTPAYLSLRSGVEMVYEKLMGELSKLGVEPIEAVGTPFDEEEHEALMRQPTPEGAEPGTVLAEVQKGYRMGDRVIRHAQVVVAE